jgi:hypothetical protein
MDAFIAWLVGLIRGLTQVVVAIGDFISAVNAVEQLAIA